MKIVNLLATTVFSDYLDLDDFSISTGIDYEPDRFPGMAVKITSPKVTINLFRSGKVVCIGAKDEAHIGQALNQVWTMLKDHGQDVFDTYDYEIINVVVTHEMGTDLNLANLTLSLPFAQTEWEPEQFPGLIYRIGRGLNSVALVFSSGKCVVTGSTTEDEARSAVEFLTEDLGQAISSVE